MATETVNLAVTIELGYFTKKGRASVMRAIRRKIAAGFVDAGEITTFAHAAKLRIMHPRWAVQSNKALFVYPKGEKKPRHRRCSPKFKSNRLVPILVVNAR